MHNLGCFGVTLFGAAGKHVTTGECARYHHESTANWHSPRTVEHLNGECSRSHMQLEMEKDNSGHDPLLPTSPNPAYRSNHINSHAPIISLPPSTNLAPAHADSLPSTESSPVRVRTKYHPKDLSKLSWIYSPG